MPSGQNSSVWEYRNDDVEDSPLVGVHIVHQVGQLGILEAVVVEQVADVAPVVLFDGGIGVVLVGA